MPKIIKVVILLGVLGGLACGAFYLTTRRRVVIVSEPDQNLVQLADTFFTKLGLDRALCLSESLRRSGFVTGTRRCGKLMVTESRPAGLSVGGKPAVEVLLSPGEDWLAAVDGDHALTLWNTATGAMSPKPIKNIPPTQSAAFSLDGKTLGAIDGKGALGLWNTVTGGEVRTLTERGSRFTALAFSPDGKTVAAGTQDGRVKLWNIADGEPLARIAAFKTQVAGLGFHPGNSSLIFASDVADVVVALLWETSFSSAALTDPPFPVAEVRVSSQVPIVAGEPIPLSVVVDNSKGKGDLYQLVGITASPEEPSLGRKLVVFGRVPAGKSVEKTVALDSNYRWPDRQIPFRVVFMESNGFSPEPVDAVVNIQGLPRPDWKIDFHAFDGKDGKGLGNADGKFQVGESLRIELAVANIGLSKAGKTVIEVSVLQKPEDGVQVFGTLSLEVKAFDVSQTAAHAFDVALKSTYQQDRLQFKVTIREDRFGGEASKDYDFPVERAVKR